MSSETSGDRTNIAPGEASAILDQLHILLARQLELVRQGGLKAAEELSERTDPLVRDLAAAGVLNAPQYRERRDALERLYRELRMALTAQRQEAFDVLRSIHRGKRLLRAYGNGLFPK